MFTYLTAIEIKSLMLALSYVLLKEKGIKIRTFGFPISQISCWSVTPAGDEGGGEPSFGKDPLSKLDVKLSVPMRQRNVTQPHPQGKLPELTRADPGT